jgi:alkylhydroperoxidase/carboxymuconolactone decarboxylase family protein YurZ
VKGSFGTVRFGAATPWITGRSAGAYQQERTDVANTKPTPPPAYEAFVARYPRLARAWEAIHEAGDDGPLDARTARLVRLAIAIGALREGAVHSSVRKARAMGITTEEVEQVVALAAGTLGLPATVAVYTWVADQPDSSD